MNDHVSEASRLINRGFDDVMTAGEERRLAELMSAHPDLLDLYIGLAQIHGQMVWGAGGAATRSAPETVPQVNAASAASAESRRTARWKPAAVLALTIAILLTAGWVMRTNQRPADKPVASEKPEREHPAPNADIAGVRDLPPGSSDPLIPLTFDSQDVPKRPHDMVDLPVPRDSADAVPRSSAELSDAEVIAAINSGIADILADNDMEFSPVASDEEWVRRAYLTLAGRIPTPEEAFAFLDGPNDSRRTNLVTQLTNDDNRHRHLAESWTNLLIGRSQRPWVNRAALSRFLQESFATNRPWISIVRDLISAEGPNDENGATNFLLAHLDNQATPATAVTSRVFLGEQRQCVQCHNHPFAEGIEQRDYWALNAFFQHTERVPRDGPMTDGTTSVVLVDRPSDGTGRSAMTYFETLRGRQQATLPTFDGQVIRADDRSPRRTALAEFLQNDSRHRVARAMVNRTWAQFFGYGFTSPVDDMGPHVPVSHPEVLDDLTEAFVASDYDLRRLQTWIALSDPWQRTSQSTEFNASDDPAAGTMPLFTHVYMRRMSPEQMYDSVRVAIQATARDRSQRERTAHRDEWVSQFVHPYNTDENDEAMQFDGSIAQAMVLMNGSDVNQAIAAASRSLIARSGSRSSAADALERITLAALTRRPTPRESALFRRRLRQLTREMSREQAVPTVVEDMLWACLNSSEFVVIH